MNAEALLMERQSLTLKAAVDRIIPEDDYPSGWDAGVGEYFTRLFAREGRYLPVYQRGLDSLEAEAHTAHGSAFSALAPDRQDALLRQVEAGKVREVWAEDPTEFFRLLVEQTIEGYYADPGNGGNKGGIAWAMVGYRVTV